MKNFNDNESNDKEKLKYYAERAKEAINFNINFHKQKEIYANYIREIKSILFDKDNIKKNFIKINQQLKVNRDKLQQEYEKIKIGKYDIYYKICTDELEMGRPLINQIKSDKFTLEYTLSQKDNLIKALTINMKNSLYFSVFRQPKRDTFIDLKDGNSNINEIVNHDRSSILKNSKSFNRLRERCNKKKIKIEKLKEVIKQLKEYIYLIKFEKTKLNQENYLKSFASNIISNQMVTNSNLKTSDRTISTYDPSSKKILANKENINNNDFILSNSERKNYEEDLKYNAIISNNEYIKNRNKNNIKNAIMSTIIPDSFNSLKYSDTKTNINPKEIFETLKNDKNYYFLNNKALSEENRKTKKIKNKKNNKKEKIIQSFLNLEELFQTSDSENESEKIIIDTVIYSDDETILENKVNQKKSLSETYLDQIQAKVPELDLDLIEYNKLKVFQEVDLYSLQRRNYKNMDIEDNIDMIKKKIKKIKKKVNINSKKVEAMKKFIDDLKNKYILYKRIKTKSSAVNSKVNYIANHEIIDLNDLNKVEEEEDYDDNDIGSDYLNENDELTE